MQMPIKHLTLCTTSDSELATLHFQKNLKEKAKTSIIRSRAHVQVQRERERLVESCLKAERTLEPS